MPIYRYSGVKELISVLLFMTVWAVKSDDIPENDAGLVDLCGGGGCWCDETISMCTDTSQLEMDWNILRSLRYYDRITLYGLNNLPPREALITIPETTSLTIVQSNIKQVKAHSFDDLQFLEYLNLKGNSIKELPVKTFAHLNALEVLILDNNEISEITGLEFYNLPFLRHLSLKSNEIKNIQGVTFQYLTQLEVLKIDNNSISYINAYTFVGLENIKKLTMASNALEEIRCNTFAPMMHSLCVLNLENNFIDNIEGEAFKGLTRLNCLNLAKNKLKVLNKRSFETLSSLSKLDLKENQIIQLDMELFMPVLYNFKNCQRPYSHIFGIDIEDNVLHCNCQLENLMQLSSWFPINFGHELLCSLNKTTKQNDDDLPSGELHYSQNGMRKYSDVRELLNCSWQNSATAESDLDVRQQEVLEEDPYRTVRSPEKHRVEIGEREDSVEDEADYQNSLNYYPLNAILNVKMSLG